MIKDADEHSDEETKGQGMWERVWSSQAPSEFASLPKISTLPKSPPTWKLSDLFPFEFFCLFVFW